MHLMTMSKVLKNDQDYGYSLQEEMLVDDWTFCLSKKSTNIFFIEDADKIGIYYSFYLLNLDDPYLTYGVCCMLSKRVKIIGGCNHIFFYLSYMNNSFNY